MLIRLLTWLVFPGKTTNRKSGGDNGLLLAWFLLLLASAI